ncbi:MAG: FecR domain-containing protein [Oceanicoccus sp.]
MKKKFPGRIKNFCSLLLIIVALCAGSSSTQAADWLYSVRPGDTLWDLCQKYTTKPDCWLNLGKVNNVEFPRRLPPGYLIRIPVPWLKEQPLPVSVSYVQGQAYVTRSDEQTSRPITIGDKLLIGSTIRTDDGSMTLTFGGGAQMLLENNSELVLDAMSSFEGQGYVDSRMRLNRGSIKTRVPLTKPRSRFSISTPAAVAAVRGTEFRVSYTDADSKENTDDAIAGDKQSTMRSEVFSGLVAVSAQSSEKDVPAGFGMIAAEGETLKQPIQLLAAPSFTMPEQLMHPARLQWTALAGAEAYYLEILNDNDNEELIYSTIQTPSSYLASVLEQDCYRARVRGIDKMHLQGIGAESKFCITPPIATPNSDSFTIATLAENTITVSWEAINDAKKYQVETSLNEQFTSNIVSTVTIDPSITIDTYGRDNLYIRVQAIGPQDQTSAFSDAKAWAANHIDRTITLVTTFLVLLLML